MAIKTKSLMDGVGHLAVLGQDPYLNYDVEIEVMRSGLNDNRWDYRNIDRFAKTFRGTPILCAYVGEKIGDGHNMKELVDPATGRKYYTFRDPTAERIVGEIYDTPEAIRLEQRDGETWIIAKGKLWRFYNPELVDKIARQGRMSVSAETNITKSTRMSDREVYEEWVGLGVTILGDDVAPAIPGAHIRAMEAIQGTFRELQLRAASLQKPQKNNKNKGVKQTVNGMSNKALLSKVQEKFPDYRVLNMTEDGSHVMLLSKDGQPCVYRANEEDHGVVIADRITPIGLSAEHKFDDDVALSCDVTEVLCNAVSEANKQRDEAAAEAEAAKNRAKELESQVNDMKEKEIARRVKACEDAVKAAVDKASCMGVDDKIAENVMQEIEDGKYSTVCNAEGNWIGAEKAVEAVMALIGTLAVNQAATANQTVSYAFGADFMRANGAQGGTDDLESLIARTSV